MGTLGVPTPPPRQHSGITLGDAPKFPLWRGFICQRGPVSLPKCFGVLVVLAVLLFLFIFNRRKMNQLSIAIALTYVALAGHRLWTLRADADVQEQLIAIAIALGAGALLWGALWGSQWWMARKANQTAKRRGDSH